MFTKKYLILILLIFWTLTACTNEPTVTEAPTTDPNMMSTSVAQTVEAELTQVAVNLPTIEPTLEPSATSTHEPTIEVPTDIPTAIPTVAPSPTQTLLPSGQAQLDNHAEFVADITIPDGTELKPGEEFTKTWRLRNIGKKTWTTAYSFVFANGDRMEGEAVNLTADVPPGATVDISVPMVAPSTAGKYIGYWAFNDNDNKIFGIGSQADLFVYIEIDVVGTTSSGPTPTPTRTPQLVVTGVTIESDRSEVISSCPYTFNFSATITFRGAQTITYQLELSTEQTGYQFPTLGPATNTATGGGQNTITQEYSISLDTGVKGTAIIHVTSPNDVKSEPLNFSLTCQ